MATGECGDDGYGGRLKAPPPLNGFGHLGRPGPPLMPLRVASDAFGDARPVLIAAGRCASFAVDSTGRVHAWGCAQGSGHPLPDQPSPKRLLALEGRRVLAIAAGEFHGRPDIW